MNDSSPEKEITPPQAASAKSAAQRPLRPGERAWMWTAIALMLAATGRLLWSVSPAFCRSHWFELSGLTAGGLVLGGLWVRATSEGERLRAVVTVLFPICIVSLVPFAYQQFSNERTSQEQQFKEQAVAHLQTLKEREAKLQAERELAARAAETLSSFRTTLVQFGSMCSPDRARDAVAKLKGRAHLFRPGCPEKVEQLEREWIDASWSFGLRSLNLLSSKVCSEATADRKIACSMLENGVADAVSSYYQKFVNAYMAYRSGEEACPDKVGEAAQSLYLTSRELGCALLVAGYPRGDVEARVPSSRCIDAFDGLAKNLKAGWPIPVNERPGLDWTRWWQVPGCRSLRALSTALVPKGR